MTYPDNCPNCNTSFQGKEIPAKDQHLFGSTHFSRVIGLSNGSSFVAWLCPDCNHQWDRHSRIRWSTKVPDREETDTTDR